MMKIMRHWAETVVVDAEGFCGKGKENKSDLRSTEGSLTLSPAGHFYRYALCSAESVDIVRVHTAGATVH